MAPAQTRGGLALDRVKQIFRFLKAFAERDVPLRRTLAEQEWTMRLAELPTHSSVRIGVVEMAGTSTAASEEAGGSDLPLLRVARPRLTNPPSPPEQFVAWLTAKYDDPRCPAGGARVALPSWAKAETIHRR